MISTWIIRVVPGGGKWGVVILSVFNGVIEGPDCFARIGFGIAQVPWIHVHVLILSPYIMRTTFVVAFVVLVSLAWVCGGSSMLAGGGGVRGGRGGVALRSAMNDEQAEKLAQFMHITNTEGCLAVGKVLPPSNPPLQTLMHVALASQLSRIFGECSRCLANDATPCSLSGLAGILNEPWMPI